MEQMRADAYAADLDASDSKIIGSAERQLQKNNYVCYVCKWCCWW